jgi:hypothetical protein
MLDRQKFFILLVWHFVFILCWAGAHALHTKSGDCCCNASSIAFSSHDSRCSLDVCFLCFNCLNIDCLGTRCHFPVYNSWLLPSFPSWWISARRHLTGRLAQYTACGPVVPSTSGPRFELRIPLGANFRLGKKVILWLAWSVWMNWLVLGGPSCKGLVVGWVSKERVKAWTTGGGTPMMRGPSFHDLSRLGSGWALFSEILWVWSFHHRPRFFLQNLKGDKFSCFFKRTKL